MIQVSAALNGGAVDLVKKQIAMVKSVVNKLKQRVSSTSRTSILEEKMKTLSFDRDYDAKYVDSKLNPHAKEGDFLETSDDLTQMKPLKRALLAIAGRQRRSLVDELQQVMNSAESTLLLGQAASEAKCHQFLNNLANEKYVNSSTSGLVLFLLEYHSLLIIIISAFHKRFLDSLLRP